MEKTSTNCIRLTRIQKLIVERMLKSKQTKPCFYLQAQADVTELMHMRPKLRKSFGVKITTNAFYIRALALAAQKFPLMVARFDGDNIKIADAVNVGFAVNAPHGLVVPVIKDANQKTIVEIAALEKILTEKARDRKLTPADIENETIALSNLGAYDIYSFIGIIPPPASCILSVGNVIDMVRPKDGQPTVCKTLIMTLAVDHRIINGAYAADFLSLIAEQLQNPQQLVC
ncbi:MAG: 2-oxo acid dehydrogenase subunit E2 [Planctomycetota bacterium]|nr:2-oxo acid dehydrogenase subunit E2 [Planctomycetota bacterium]